jgi:hypothetical protein
MSDRTFRRVQIEWVDSVSDGGWTTYDDALSRAETKGVLNCTSIGLLLSDSDEYVLLCTSHMRDGDLIQGCLQIPRCAVRDMKDLRR